MARILNISMRLTLALVVLIALSGAPQHVSAQDGDDCVDRLSRSIGCTERQQLEPPPDQAAPIEPALIPGSVFNPYTTYAMNGADGYGAGIGDFNTDGLNDIAVSISGTSTGLWVFLQQADGTLVPSGTYAVGGRPENLVTGDFNNDSRDDVATANFSNNTISIFLQTAGGVLSPQVTYPTTTGPDALVADDLNNDGLTDLAVSHWNNTALGVFFQQADGTMGTMTWYPSQQSGYDDIDTGDFNNDGLTDIVKMNGQGYANANFMVYLQIPGGFADPVNYDLTGSINSSGIAAGDLTGDGRDDIALAYGGNDAYITIFAQTEDGALEQQTTYPAYDIPESMEIADVNLDGHLDLLAVHGGWEALTVYFQRQDGSLANYQRYTLPYASHYSPQGFDIGDINGDGLLDAVIADYNYGLVVLTNRITPDFSIIPSTPDLVIENGKVGQVTLDLDTLLGFNVPVTYSVYNLPAGVSYSFTNNPVTPPNSTTLRLFASPSTTLGNRTITIRGTSGSLTHTASIYLRIVERITGLSVTSSAPTWLGSSTWFEALTDRGSSISYTWDFGDGSTGTGSALSHTYATLGQYTVKVTASNAINSLDITLTVNVVDVPITGLQAIALVRDEPGFTADLYAFIGGGTNVVYEWDFGDGTTGSGPVVSHTYSASEEYILKITATNSQESVTRAYRISPGGLQDPTYYIFLPATVKSP